MDFAVLLNGTWREGWYYASFPDSTFVMFQIAQRLPLYPVMQARLPHTNSLSRSYRNWPAQEGWGHWLLVRRSLTEPDKVAAYLVFAPEATLFETMVAVAGRRWTVEESLELGKGEVGLDQYEVRHWVGWYRHITLSMLALAYLTVVRTRAQEEAEKRGLSTLLS
jgi:SRSO17 transposase